MSRSWNEFVGALLAVVPLPAMLVLLFVVATLVAVLWYFFPAWVPRRLPRLRWRRPALRWPRWRLRWPQWRWRWPKLRWPRLRWHWLRLRRPKRADEPVAPAPAAADEMPDLPATDFASLADRLAEEGRYAEAIRERLRGMVRELIERGILEHRPGWTVTELAAAAVARRPAVAGPLGEAGRIFSDIWYGQRPAGPRQDARMRQLVADLKAALNTSAPQPASTPEPATVGAAA